MHFGIYDLHRKHCGQLRKRRHALATQLRTDPLSRSLDPKPATTFDQIHLTVYRETFTTRMDEIIEAPRSK
jgi:hypothetical protein